MTTALSGRSRRKQWLVVSCQLSAVSCQIEQLISMVPQRGIPTDHEVLIETVFAKENCYDALGATSGFRGLSDGRNGQSSHLAHPAGNGHRGAGPDVSGSSHLYRRGRSRSRCRLDHGSQWKTLWDGQRRHRQLRFGFQEWRSPAPAGCSIRCTSLSPRSPMGTGRMLRRSSGRTETSTVQRR